MKAVTAFFKVSQTSLRIKNYFDFYFLAGIGTVRIKCEIFHKQVFLNGKI